LSRRTPADTISLPDPVVRPSTGSLERPAPAKPRLPFGAAGLLTTRPQPGELVSPADDVPQTVEIKTLASGILYVRCPGLTLVWARTAPEFSAAIELLRSFRTRPHENGTVVLPPRKSLHPDVDLYRSLTREGIVVRTAEQEDPREALTKLAEAYLHDVADGLEDLDKFMNEDDGAVGPR
jgi:hypothetical protein